jgi:hypothetical protein
MFLEALLLLTSPTGGGSSVGIVHSRTKATEFNLVYNPFHIIIKYSYTNTETLPTTRRHKAATFRGKIRTR